ncbi:MAG: hypothetical protein IJX99_03830 [Clostridia bacterium]|nr:hypothetical protein [Clostridia bacterium]
MRRRRRPRIPIVRKLQLGIASEEEWRAYYWLRNEFITKRAHFLSGKSIFGVVGFEVPVYKCDPAIVEQIMAELGTVLLDKETYYNARTGNVYSVYLTYDTPEIGVINMPI